MGKTYRKIDTLPKKVYDSRFKKSHKFKVLKKKDKLKEEKPIVIVQPLEVIEEDIDGYDDMAMI